MPQIEVGQICLVFRMLLSFWLFKGGFGFDWWGRYRFIEIHRVLAAVSNIEPTNITNGTWIIKFKSNANHGTDYLNLPIDCWIFEASIEGVYFHAICFAQHLPGKNFAFLYFCVFVLLYFCIFVFFLIIDSLKITFVQCQLLPSWEQSLPLDRACSCWKEKRNFEMFFSG